MDGKLWSRNRPEVIRGGFFHLYNSLTFLIFVPRIQRGACHVPIQYVPQAEIIPIEPARVMP